MSDSEPMSGALYDQEMAIESAIINYEQAASESPASLLVGWVVIAEWVNADGEPELSAFAREGLPHWRISGLLDAAPEAMCYADED